MDADRLRANLLRSSHDVVDGYHATSVRAARRILAGAPFRLSRNRYDWLGDGVYFWEAAPERAWEWTQQPRVKARLGTQVAVIGARIHLDRCMDFHDTVWHKPLRDVYEYLRERYERTQRALPQQTAWGKHGWDREVINQLVLMTYRITGVEIGAVRASFREPGDEPIFGDSALYQGAHVQIAVRDQRLIEERWLARGDL